MGHFLVFVPFNGRDARGFRISLKKKEETSISKYFFWAGAAKSIIVSNI